MHKKIMAIVLTLAMLLTFAACGTSNQSSTQTTAAAAGSAEAAAPAEEEPITCTLTIWSPSEDQDPEYGAWIVTMCEQFAELHPNWDITFNYGVCTESDAKSLIPQDLDAAADVFVYSSTGLEKLCQSNSLAQFGGTYLDQINENYSSVLVDCLTYEDGGVYGVPMTTNTYFMYYDSSVFTEEDITSLEAMLEKGKVAISLTDGFYLSCFYLANGCTFFGESGTDRAAGVDLSGDKAVAVTDYLVDLAKSENLVVASPADAISMMREGQVDAYFCGTWQAAQTEEVSEFTTFPADVGRDVCGPIDVVERRVVRVAAGPRDVDVEHGFGRRSDVSDAVLEDAEAFEGFGVGGFERRTKIRFGLNRDRHFLAVHVERPVVLHVDAVNGRGSFTRGDSTDARRFGVEVHRTGLGRIGVRVRIARFDEDGCGS